MKQSISLLVLSIIMCCFFNVSAQKEKDVTKEMITFFHKACFYDATDTLAKILYNTPEIIDYRNSELSTALHIAAQQGNINICKLLVEGDADVNAENEYGYTPVYYAVESDNADIVRLLVDNGADYDLRDRVYVTSAFLYAIITGKSDIVSYLISVGAKTDLICLKYAMDGNHKDIFDMLMQQKFDINKQSIYFGTSILQSSVINADSYYLDRLLQKNPILNTRDSILGRTALHEAVLNRRTAMAKKLIDKNANISIADDLGLTAADYAEIENYNEILDYIREKQ